MELNATFFILIAVMLIAIVGVMYLSYAYKSPDLNREKYQTKWLEIENSLVRANPATFPLAIMNADKLVDQALKERRFKGDTMGERMKSAQSTWRNANHVWGAHKIRNQLAHETDYTVDYTTAARALAAFKQALKDLGAI